MAMNPIQTDGVNVMLVAQKNVDNPAAAAKPPHSTVHKSPVVMAC